MLLIGFIVWSRRNKRKEIKEGTEPKPDIDGNPPNNDMLKIHMAGIDSASSMDSNNDDDSKEDQVVVKDITLDGLSMNQDIETNRVHFPKQNSELLYNKDGDIAQAEDDIAETMGKETKGREGQGANVDNEGKTATGNTDGNTNDQACV